MRSRQRGGLPQGGRMTMVPVLLAHRASGWKGRSAPERAGIRLDRGAESAPGESRCASGPTSQQLGAPTRRFPACRFTPIRSRSLSEQVFEQVAAEIITGRYAPGSNLPAERALTVVFDVNRHVVREALKRLEQIGLVKSPRAAGPRCSTSSATRARSARGDVGARPRGDDVAAIWLAVLEMRVVIAADTGPACAPCAPGRREAGPARARAPDEGAPPARTSCSVSTSASGSGSPTGRGTSPIAWRSTR